MLNMSCDESRVWGVIPCRSAFCIRHTHLRMSGTWGVHYKTSELFCWHAASKTSSLLFQKLSLILLFHSIYHQQRREQFSLPKYFKSVESWGWWWVSGAKHEILKWINAHLTE